jgi:hypothetical protein
MQYAWLLVRLASSITKMTLITGHHQHQIASIYYDNMTIRKPVFILLTLLTVIMLRLSHHGLPVTTFQASQHIDLPRNILLDHNGLVKLSVPLLQQHSTDACCRPPRCRNLVKFLLLDAYMYHIVVY